MARKKIMKYKIPLLVLLALILISIPLILLNPVETDFTSKIPEEFTQLESRKINTVYKDYKLFSSYMVTNQISSSRAARISMLGIGGHVFYGEITGLSETSFLNSTIVFLINCMIWMPSLLEGAKITILLTITSVFVGLIGSIFLALGKMSKFKPIRFLSDTYIFFFRGTPLLMQLFFIYYGLPILNPAFSINNRFTAAWVAFSLNSAAYCAEIIRAGIQSIDKGQFEAAKVLGFSYAKTMRLIIIPQTYRRLIPPIANEFIMVLKDASLTSIIALQDLSKVTQSIMTSTSNVTIYLPSMAIYLIITAFFTKFFASLEKKFSVYE